MAVKSKTNDTIIDKNIYAQTSDYKPLHINVLEKVMDDLYNQPKQYEKEYLTYKTELNKFNIDLLARLLFLEASITSFECQIYVCNAILNYCEEEEMSLYEASHNYMSFEVAPHIDSCEATEQQYDVIEHVLDGNRLEDVTYFRTDYYHDFGTPICNIDNVYFSSP